MSPDFAADHLAGAAALACARLDATADSLTRLADLLARRGVQAHWPPSEAADSLIKEARLLRVAHVNLGSALQDYGGLDP